MLSAGFSIGSSYATEAALRCWLRVPLHRFAVPLPFQGRLGESFNAGRSNLSKATISGVHRENQESIANRTQREMPAGAARFGQKNGKFHRESAVPESFSKKICDFAKKHLLFFVKYAKIGMYEKSARIASVLRVHALFS